MSRTAGLCKILIIKGRYEYDDMYTKLDLFLMMGRISDEEYVELTGMMQKPEEPEEPDYVSILEDMSHSQMTHQFGHDTLPQESETDSHTESTESSETASKSAK